MYMKNLHIKIFYIIFCLALLSGNLCAQTDLVQFGKNRVQYHDDFDQWLFYETPSFTVYWYGKSKAAGQKVVRLAEQEFKQITQTIDFKTNEKTEILVFADLSDMKQSNIGLDEAFELKDKLTKTLDNKIFIYFDGNHNHLRRQIREGIASVYINNILFGSNLQEIVQNSIMLNLPEWYKSGLISYFGDTWTPEIELKLRSLLSHKKISNFERLAKADPTIAGHLFWHYLDINYGKSTIGNLVYVTRINRNLKRAFQYALGIQYDDFMQSVFQYYKNSYPALTNDRKEEKLSRLYRMKVGEQVSALKYSPDGSKIALAANNLNKVKLWLIDPISGKKKKLYSYGVKNKIQLPDLNYPVFAWNKTGNKLMTVYERRDYIYLREFDLASGKSRVQLLPEKYERVYSVAYWSDRSILINGSTDGYGNIYLYDLPTRQSKTVLEDPWDDLDMTVADGTDGGEIYFSSNRKHTRQLSVSGDSILPVGTFDIFRLRPVDPSANELTWQMDQITFTPAYNEFAAQVDESKKVLSFLTDEYKNKAIVTIQKDQIYPDSNQMVSIYNRAELLDGFTVSGRNEIGIVTGFNGENYFCKKINAAEIFEGNNAPKTRTEGIEVYNNNTGEPDAKNALPDVSQVIIPDSLPAEKKFITRWGDIVYTPNDKSKSLLNKNAGYVNTATQYMTPLNRLNIVPYRLQFRMDETGTRFDNSLLFDGLSTYAGAGGDGLVTPMGLLLRAKLKDKFDDYQLEGGIRIPISLNGNETYLVFDNLKNRLDQRIALYRKVLNDTDESNNAIKVSKNIVLLGQYEIKFPIDIFNAFKLGAILRQDKSIYRATNSTQLERPNESIERIGLRATYIMDNALEQGLNLYEGTRAKVFAEWIKKFDLQTEDNLALKFNKGHMWVAGLDARQYVPLDGRSILAGRLSSQVSFGSEKILYYLGGVEGWLFPAFDENTRIDGNENYAYRMPATNLRGFRYNVRNGNNFALTNIELRVPIFRYLTRGTIKSAFFKNFQLNFFFDAGTAWNGWNPFVKFNPLNTVVIDQKDIVIKINYFRNPVVFGYGAGARLLLFGYFVRLDYARGYDSGNLNPAKFYISLGKDF